MQDGQRKDALKNTKFLTPLSISPPRIPDKAKDSKRIIQNFFNFPGPSSKLF